MTDPNPTKQPTSSLDFLNKNFPQPPTSNSRRHKYLEILCSSACAALANSDWKSPSFGYYAPHMRTELYYASTVIMTNRQAWMDHMKMVQQKFPGTLFEAVEMGSVARRLESNSPDSEEVYLFIDNVAAFRMLQRPDDDFSLEARDPALPANALAAVLRDGAAVGVHLVLWCDNLNNLGRTLDPYGDRQGSAERPCRQPRRQRGRPSRRRRGEAHQPHDDDLHRLLSGARFAICGAGLLRRSPAPPET